MKKIFLFFVILLVISGCTREQQEDIQEYIEETDDEDLPPELPADSQTQENLNDIPALPSEDIEETVPDSLDLSEKIPAPEINLNVPPEFVGLWRSYSSRLFYDKGGGGAVGTDSSTKLELQDNGKWNYGSSSGTWGVEQINSDDWVRWQIESYGPTRKLILNDWKESSADGPVEESNQNIDFLWVLYKAVPPTVSEPGTVHMKFGQ